MSVTHLNPFDQAFPYRGAGWGGPLPLPYKKKMKPPVDYTGHRAKYPSVDDIKEWLNEGKRNICLRLAGVDEQHEIIGIDVDHYQKGEKDKRGGDQLSQLELTLGTLPDTWISSSRTDGISGIRYFRVPRGMAFRGQVDKDIECISKGYRYAIVWPSIHDELGSTYWWFPPGTPPSDSGKSQWESSSSLPLARELPILPPRWLDYLTQGGMKATHQRIDMDSSRDEIYTWADNTFHSASTDSKNAICALMREKLDKLKAKVESEATSHDKITNGHWNIMRLAAEGHLGWNEAVDELEQCFFDEMLKRNKRGDEIHGEIFRSRIEALRKIKGDCDERVQIGAAPIDERCDRMGGLCCVSAPVADPNDPTSGIPTGGTLRLTGDYELNDDGNAAHFVDYFSDAHGPSVRYAEGRGWLIWREATNVSGTDTGVSTPHWEVDEDGTQTMRRMWHKIKQRQLQYVDALEGDYHSQVQAWNFNGPMPANVKAAKALWDRWRRFAEINGNNKNANSAIESVKSINQVSINVNKLDQNPYLLGVANGVIELDNENVRLRKAQASDYVTLNTGVEYARPSSLASQTWQEYLDTFLPNDDLQRATQIALGHCLVGGNPEKIMIVLKGKPNTGKSTMVTALQTSMGDYAESVNQSIFQNHKLNPILADAITKRVIVCSEFDEEDRLSASMVKRLTGGSDEIRAEKKGSNAKFAGIPQFVPILATNEVPKIAGADKALQNRLFVIPFNITPRRLDKKFANVIQKICGPAILEWLVDGFKEYRRINEIPMIDEVRIATESFVSELDEVATFAAEKVKADEGEYVKSALMYEKFCDWWRVNNYQPRLIPSQHLFTRRLKALGYQYGQYRVNGESAKFWSDVSVRSIMSNVYSIPKPRVAGKTETDQNRNT